MANFEGDGHFEVRTNEWPEATFTVYWVTETATKRLPVTFSSERLEQLRTALNAHAEASHGD